MSDLTFIIPCFNSGLTLSSTLTSIFNQKTSYTYDVIVVDNGSRDNSMEIARKFPVEIFQEELRGPNHARNLGIKNAKSQYIAFIDSDVILEPDWAQELLSYMKRKSLSAGMGKILRATLGDPNTTLEKYRRAGEHHSHQGMSLITPGLHVGFINTAACIYEAKILATVHSFSETLRFHEDVDLTLKVRTLPGIAIGCTGNAVARCYYTKGLASYLKRAFVYGYFYAYLERKWNFKKKAPTEEMLSSPLLNLFDQTLSFMRMAGENLGKIVLNIIPPKTYVRECLQWKKISSLSGKGNLRVYFEDQEILPNGNNRTV